MYAHTQGKIMKPLDRHPPHTVKSAKNKTRGKESAPMGAKTLATWGQYINSSYNVDTLL